MIQLDLFQQRLKVLKDEFDFLNKSVDTFIANCSVFIDDMSNGVPSGKLIDIIIESYVNLFLNITHNTKLDTITDLIYYYIFEGNFGGKISDNGKEWDLSDSSQLYDYLTTI